MCYTPSQKPLTFELVAYIKIKIAHFTWVFPILVAHLLSQDTILGADFFPHSMLFVDIAPSQIHFKFCKHFKIPLFIPNTKFPVSNNSLQVSARQRQILNIAQQFPND